MVHVGVIGCGKIAQVRHLPEYAANPRVKIVGLYDLNKKRAQTLAEQYSATAFDSAEALLADQSITAVSICTANVSHALMTITALNAGKHVLCEKPMAITLSECEAMTAAAKKAGKFLMIGHNQRLTKAHAKARALIKEGVIGDIITFRTTFGHGGPETWTVDTDKNWFFDKSKAAFGALADLGIHKTDLIQFLTGQKVKEVSAYIGTLHKKNADASLIGVDDNAICTYVMDGGAVGTMTASWTYYGKEDNSTILYGSRGIMRIYDDPAHSIVVISEDGASKYYDIDSIQTNDKQDSSGVIDLWVTTLTSNTPPEISGEEALAAMRAVFACVESARTGMWVKV